MGISWPKVKMGEVLRRSQQGVDIVSDKEYKEVTVRLWGKGVFLRGVVQGSSMSGTRRFVVRSGQLILSKIDARNGALGIVPDALDGAVVSTDFPVFDVERSRLDAAFVGWLTKTAGFIELCQQASEGSTNRVRLKEERFLSIKIPIPPLTEQRRMVARIEELAGKIEEARRLRRKAMEEGKALLRGAIDRVFSNLAAAYQPKSFGQFSPHVTSGPRNWANHYGKTDFRFYRAQDIGSYGKILEGNKTFITPPAGTQGRSAMPQAGDLLLVITGATVGRVAVFQDDHETGFVNQHVAICRLPQSEIDPQFALWGLRGPEGQKQLLGRRYGQGKPGLNLSNIRSLSLPIPPMKEQLKTVACLNEFQSKVDSLEAMQAESAAELDALLPAVLDRAFKGEL